VPPPDKLVVQVHDLLGHVRDLKWYVVGVPSLTLFNIGPLAVRRSEQAWPSVPLTQEVQSMSLAAAVQAWFATWPRRSTRAICLEGMP